MPDEDRARLTVIMDGRVDNVIRAFGSDMFVSVFFVYHVRSREEEEEWGFVMVERNMNRERHPCGSGLRFLPEQTR